MAGVLELLKAERELLADEARWTQYTLARDADGSPVKPHDPTAVCWCVLGGLYNRKDVIGSGIASVSQAMALLDVRCPPQGVMHCNDTLGHAAVLAALDGAILDAGGP